MNGGYTAVYAGKRSHIVPGTVDDGHLARFADDYTRHEWHSTWTGVRKALADYLSAERDEWADLARNVRYMTETEFAKGVDVPRQVVYERRRDRSDRYRPGQPDRPRAKR